MYYGFGGISVLLQVFSIISKSDISIKPYILGKLLQGIFAGFYTYIALKYISILNFDVIETSTILSSSTSINFKWFFWAILGIIILVGFVYKKCDSILAQRNKKKKFST